jgi:predicted ferric reductase
VQVLVLIFFCALFIDQINSAGGVEASGELTSKMIALTFLTATRNSVLTLVLGLPFERAIFWHKFFALWSFIAAMVHGVAAGLEEEEDMVNSGLWAGCAMGLLVATGLFTPLRRFAFDLFYRFHWLLFLTVIIALYLHGATDIIYGVLFWGFDVVFRMVFLAGVKNSRTATLKACAAGVTCVTIPRRGECGLSFNYRAGQYVFLCVPTLGLFEWHPFTISVSGREVA